MNTKDECILMDNVMCYSTMSGELPKMVREGIPKTMVSWTDYVTLQRKYEKVLERLNWKESVGPENPVYIVK